MASADSTYPGRGVKQRSSGLLVAGGEGIGAHRQYRGRIKARGFSVYYMQFSELIKGRSGVGINIHEMQ